MRLPWPFRRETSTPPLPAAGGDGAAPVGGEWRRVPPLAETIGPPPLVAPSRPFAADLATSNQPPPIVAPLGHGKGLDAPSGIVVGLARPSRSMAGPPVGPIQRKPARPEPPFGPPEVDVPDERDEPTVVAAPHRVPPAETGAATPRTPPVPVSARPAIAALTRVGESEQLILAPPGRGVIGTPVAPNDGVTAAPGPTSLGGASLPVQRPSPAPLLPGPSVDGSTLRPGLPSSPSTGDGPGARLTLGQARRLGLGAPITGGLAPRTGGGTAPPGPLGAPATPAPTPSAELPHRPPGESSSVGAALATGLPVPEPQPSAPPVGSRPPAGAASRAHPPVSAGAERAAPIVSARPLRGGIQRAAVAGAAPVPRSEVKPPAREEAARPATEGAVRIHRDPIASQLSEALDARSFTHGGEIYLPARHGPLDAPRARSLLAHELTHVAQQRRMGRELPPEESGHGRALESEAVAAERAPELTLAVPPAPASSPATTDRPPSSAATPQRSPSSPKPSDAGSVTIDFPTGYQRAPSTPAAVADIPSGSGAGSTPRSEKELEDLAQQLYGRIGQRLRRELLVDRERAGLLVDLP